MTVALRPVMRYHGGKAKIAHKIIKHFPLHRVYVEPFGGAGSVLMQKPIAYAEIYNDKFSDVVNVFRVLRDPIASNRLREVIQLTPFSRDEFMATDHSACSHISDPVERARLTIFRSVAGFGSAAANPHYNTGFRANSTRSGTTPAHDWANYPKMIQRFHERLSGVVIENREAIDVIQQHDSPDTLHYVDPPYTHGSRSTKNLPNGGRGEYVHEMTDADHSALSKVLLRANGMVVVSGYNSDLYETLYGDWRKVELLTFSDGARERTEVLWFNATAWDRKPEPIFDFQEAA